MEYDGSESLTPVFSVRDSSNDLGSTVELEVSRSPVLRMRLRSHGKESGSTSKTKDDIPAEDSNHESGENHDSNEVDPSQNTDLTDRQSVDTAGTEETTPTPNARPSRPTTNPKPT